MPLIHMRILEGRTTAQKREMVAKVSQIVSETLICPLDAVKISIEEMKPEHYAVGGQLIADRT